MEALKHIVKIRQYLNYVEEHIRNVQRAWNIVYSKCKDMHPFTDDFLYHTIAQMIIEHDISKLSVEEFIPYQQKFYPVYEGHSNDLAFDYAWEHHKAHNPHHWENWTKREESFPNENLCHCVCMVVDWVAMGMSFENDAEEYYEKNKERIDLPWWAVTFIREIFRRLR